MSAVPLFWRTFFVTGLLAMSLPVSAAGRTDLGGPFRLTDHNGQSVSDADYHGKPVLLYFGFATCPDVCPTDLAKMAVVVRRLEEQSEIEITPIFVTIDPGRDTPERLAEYVRFFHPSFVGLTGDDNAIAQIADRYAVYYEPVATDSGYTMDHSTFMFLLGVDGEYLAHYGRSVTAEELIGHIRDRLNQVIPHDEG